MQMTDNIDKTYEVKRIDSERIVGVRIKDRVVTFSKGGDEITGKFGFTINGEGKYKFVITDLKAGNWQIKKNGKIIIPTLEAKSDEGTLCLKEPPENMSLTDKLKRWCVIMTYHLF